jgi:hypothetical protein
MSDKGRVNSEYDALVKQLKQKYKIQLPNISYQYFEVFLWNCFSVNFTLNIFTCSHSLFYESICYIYKCMLRLAQVINV